VRAAREYCLLALAELPLVGPPTFDQSQRMERWSEMAIAMLQKALTINPTSMKKDFPQAPFRILEHRADYQTMVAALESES
jgi:hypothetical protein